MNDDMDQILASHRSEPRPEFAEELLLRLRQLDAQPAAPQPGLWARIVQHLTARKERPMNRRSRVLRPALAVMMVLALFVTLPPLRAVASDILAQLGLITITNAPTHVERALDDGFDGFDVEATPIYLDEDGDVPPAAELSAQLGFPIYEPQPLPEDFKLADRAMTPNRMFIVSFYRFGERWTPSYLSLYQSLAGSWEAADYPVGAGATVEEILVGTHQGLWIENTSRGINGPGTQGEMELVYYNILLWTQDGYLFELVADPGTPRELLMQLAESMAPAQ